MALITCPECGRGCSDRAPQCPQCGCPIASAAVAPVASAPGPQLVPPQKSGTQRSSAVPLLLLVLVAAGGYFLYQRSQQAERRARPHSPTTTSFSSPPSDNDNSGARPGQAVVNKLESLPEGSQYILKIPAGHYRVRVTSSNKGIKARWVGVACEASRSEQKVYETTCDPAAEVQFIIENPTTLGLGPTEEISVSVVTR